MTDTVLQMYNNQTSYILKHCLTHLSTENRVLQLKQQHAETPRIQEMFMMGLTMFLKWALLFLIRKKSAMKR